MAYSSLDHRERLVPHPYRHIMQTPGDYRSKSTLPSTCLDAEGDVLYIKLVDGVLESITAIDNDEIFVHSLPSGEVIGFTIPYFTSYWRKNLKRLEACLKSHAPSCSPQFSNILYWSSGSTPRVRQIV